MALTEDRIKELIEKYLESRSITLSELNEVDDNGDVWIFGTKDGVDGKKESVKIKLSDIKGVKGEDGETRQEVSVYMQSETQPDTPEGDVVPPPNGWMLKQTSSDGTWWVSKGTFVVNPDDSYGRMVGSWSIPTKITVKDGNITKIERRYYSSMSMRLGDVLPSFTDKISAISPGVGWKKGYRMANSPNMNIDYINNIDEPAEYNQFLEEEPVYLWETEAQILDGELLIPWSEPILKTLPVNDKPKEPYLTPILNIDASSYLMICDPETYLPLPANQQITITARHQNFGDLTEADVTFKMISYDAGGSGISSTTLVTEIVDNLPTTVLSGSNWEPEFAKVEIICTIGGNSATVTIHRHTNTKYGDSVVFGYLAPPSKNFPATEDGFIPEEIYTAFRGQFVLLDAGETIIDDGTNNDAVKFSFRGVTPGLVIAIVENGKWKSNITTHPINGTSSEDEDEGDGKFKILDYPPSSDSMSITIISEHRNIKYPALFSIEKIKKSDTTEPPISNTDTKESIFTLTKGYVIPEITINPDYISDPESDYQKDNFIPDKLRHGDNVTYTPDYITWHAKPRNVDEINNHLWRSDRTKTNGVWRAFDPPYLWTNYSLPPEIDPNARLRVFLENGFEVFNGHRGEKAEVFVRSYLDTIPQTPTEILVGDNIGNTGTYGEMFNFEIDASQDKITFTLNRDVDEYENSFIPIQIKVNDMDFSEPFKYIVTPYSDNRYVMKLTTTSSIITRDLTDTNLYKKDSTPEFIEVVGQHLNVDNLEWSYKIDGVGSYEAITGSTKGISVMDNVVTITTADLDVAIILNIKLSGKTIPDGYDVCDIIGINIVHHGRTGLPGKTPFTRVWKEGESYRNNLSAVDYIYYRDPNDILSRNGWFKLTDKYETYESGPSPYSTGTTILKDTDGDYIYEKIDSLGTKAFDLVIAEEANLAGFVFKNNKLYSQDWVTEGGKTTASLMLDGKNGKIVAKGAKIEGEITATEGFIGDFKVENGYLTGYRRVKVPGSEDNLITTMGLNANYGDDKDTAAFWAGGSLNDVYAYVNNPTPIEDRRKKDIKTVAYISHNGQAFFTNAVIEGKIIAIEGKIGGFNVGGSVLTGYGKNEDGESIPTLGLNANYEHNADKGGKAFWAGLPASEGRTSANAIIWHDGSSEFTNTVIKGDVTATSGLIGNFKIDGSTLKGYKNNDTENESNVTMGLSANSATSDNKVAFWAGGNIGDMYESNTDSIAYITHDGKAFFNDMEIKGRVTATEGYIGNWKIEDGSLVSNDFNGFNRASIKIEESGGRFIRINDSAESIMSIRADSKTALRIYTQSALGVGISISAQTGSTAIVSRGSHDFYQRSGEYWNAPGILLAVTFKLSSTRSFFTHKWCVDSLKNLSWSFVRSGVYRLQHNLGHNDYIPIGKINAGDGAVDKIIKNDTYCDIHLAGAYNTNKHSVDVILIGRNKLRD